MRELDRFDWYFVITFEELYNSLVTDLRGKVVRDRTQVSNLDST